MATCPNAERLKVDFNFESVDCPAGVASSRAGAPCHWTAVVQQTRLLLPDTLLSMTMYDGSGGGALGVLRAVKHEIDFAQADGYGGPGEFFGAMKDALGGDRPRVYYGVEADFPKTPLAAVAGLAAAWNSSGAAGIFLWTANRDIATSTSCLDPVRGGATDHPTDWAYTRSIHRGMFPPKPRPTPPSPGPSPPTPPSPPGPPRPPGECPGLTVPILRFCQVCHTGTVKGVCVDGDPDFCCGNSDPSAGPVNSCSNCNRGSIACDRMKVCTGWNTTAGRSGDKAGGGGNT